MQALLYVDLASGSVSGSLNGGGFQWPRLIQGDDLSLSLRLTQLINGAISEIGRAVHGLRATLGKVDARPQAGSFALSAGGGETGALAFNATAQEMETAINALTGLGGQLPVTVTLRDESYLIQSADGALINFTVSANSLWPMSFVRLREFQFNGKWLTELRLIQTPVAFTNAFARVVPAAPVISRVQAGGYNDSLKWNEVQKLYVPPQFRGNYQIRRGFAKSTLLSTEDGPDEIKTALETLLEADGEFKITNPLPNNAHIEFTGSMGGASWPLLDIVVVDAPEGDLTINLSLNTEELDTLLRGESKGEAKLPFEVEAVVEDENDSNTLYTLTLIRAELTVARELTQEELANYPAIDWLRPPLPRDYVPVPVDQIAVGGQHTRVVLGDNAATQFTVVHNLNEDGLHVTLRENIPNGRMLNAPEDYSIVFNDANSLTLTVVGPPIATGVLAVLISTASSRSVFQAHTHSMGQIDGLQSLVDDLGGRVVTLESVVAINAATVEANPLDPQVATAQWTLPTIAELYPGRAKLDKDTKAASAIDLTKLPRGVGLLAAIHDAAAEELPLPLPPADESFIGRLFQNQSAGSVALAGALGHKAVTLLQNEYAACDGRLWYRVANYGAETSYYPTDFDRELFVITVNEKQLRQKKKLDVSIGLELAVLKSNTNAQWVLVIEHGTFSYDTTPATTGINLKDVEWNETPILAQRLLVTQIPLVHTFGCRIGRSITVVEGIAVDTLTTSRIFYGGEEGASGPETANFALRARLIKFDTENHQTDPRGIIALLGMAGQLEGATTGKAIIK